MCISVVAGSDNAGQLSGVMESGELFIIVGYLLRSDMLIPSDL